MPFGYAQGRPMPASDLLLLNGRLLTMAGRKALGRAPGQASALAVVGDRIVAVGDDDEIAGLRGPRTRVLDLHGRLALPGFTDSHVHLVGLARRLSQVDLSRASTLGHALRRVAARVRATPRGSWITGGGFDKNRWALSASGGFPTRGDLDRVAPSHPVALYSRDGHSVWLNSLALKVCGITKRSRAPAGGVIVRDARGEPTGILQERATVLLRGCPSFRQGAVTADVGRGGVQGSGAERRADDLKAALRSLLRQGVTSVHVMEEAETLGAVQELRDRGELPVRLTLYRSRHYLEDLIAAGVRSGFGDEWIRIGGVKLLVDGSLGSQTAWMFRRYRGADLQSANPCGVPVLYGKELREIVARAQSAGLACAIHAIGDRANAEALDAIAAAAGPGWPEGSPKGDPALQHRIEHAQLLRRRDIPRFAQLGVIASMQPCHLLGDIPVADRYWGRRSRWAYPIASLLRAGATVAFGSDAPVETSNPVEGVYAAVQRQMLNGEPRGGWYRKEEGIGVRGAVWSYTVGPALASGEGGFKGKLLPGYLADIVVLSDDTTRLRGRALLRARPDLVVVGGRVRHRRPGA
jgi:predicted amidohydrolase YtcJ